MQPGGGVVLVLVEAARQLHDRGFNGLGIGRAGLGAGRFQRANAIIDLVLALAHAGDAVLGGFQFRALAFAGTGDLVGQLGDGLVDAGQGLGGELFGGFDPLGQAVDHGAQQPVLVFIDRLLAAETGKGFQRIVPFGFGRVGFFQDDAIDPFAQRQALATRSRLRSRPGAGIDPFHAPRTTGRHSESLAQLNRPKLFRG